MRTHIVHIVLILSVSGCTDWGVEDNGFRHITAQERSNSNAEVTFVVPVDKGDSSVLLTASTAENWVVLYEVLDPSGVRYLAAEEEWESVQNRTGAVFPADTVSINWPITEDDAPLREGKWRFTFRTLDEDFYYTPGVTIDGDALIKQDASLSEGVVTVALVYGGGLEGDALIVSAVSDAVDVWYGLYAAIGLTLEVTIDTTTAVSLWPPGFGNGPAYTDIAAAQPLGTIPIVLLPEVSGFPTGTLYGMSGGIPGPLVDTGHSAVLVDIMTHAGVDLVFNDEEKRILGETLGHELGHYLGLFHPNEIDLPGYDALDDTTECADLDACEDIMGDNLMYPYPICNSFSCQPQSELTLDQSGVMMRYTGVN